MPNTIAVEDGEPRSASDAGQLELVFPPDPLRLAVYRDGKLLLESSTDRTISGDAAPASAGRQRRAVAALPGFATAVRASMAWEKNLAGWTGAGS